jgi:epoxyqueuosine reductase
MTRRQKKTDKPSEDPSRLAKNLLRRLNSYGYKSAMVSVARLADLRKEIDERRRAGQFAPELFDKRYTSLNLRIEPEHTWASSIVIVAAPQPHVRLGIKPNGRPLSVIIPPTYTVRTDHDVERVVRGVLEPAGHRIFQQRLPLKLLATRTGLARYGRNNLTYVEGMGSYCSLLAFYTSLPVQDFIWIDPQPLSECEKCVACIKKCPTQAIGKDRFLIRAERCLTFHNESIVDFPPELRPDWHHCLIGCLYCQTYCPVNKKVGGWVEDCGTLSEHDTAVLLDGGSMEEMSESGRRIMEEFEFIEDFPQISRNLKTLLDTPANVKRAEKLLPVTRDKI